MRHITLTAFTGLLLTACSGGGGGGSMDVDAGGSTDAGEGAGADASVAADEYSVLFETTAGAFTIDVNRDWSPNGADRFADLVDAEYYDGCRFFRVVPGFMVQFGINGTPATHAMWKDSTIADDSIVESNTRGYVSFAQTGAPNSRTTQLFINYVDNSFLDPMNFTPFGVIRAGGMDSVDAINSEYGEAPDQGQITNVGTPYLDKNFPNLDFVQTARRIP